MYKRQLLINLMPLQPLQEFQQLLLLEQMPIHLALLRQMQAMLPFQLMMLKQEPLLVLQTELPLRRAQVEISQRMTVLMQHSLQLMAPFRRFAPRLLHSVPTCQQFKFVKISQQPSSTRLKAVLAI